jgi:hypothetical protein
VLDHLPIGKAFRAPPLGRRRFRVRLSAAASDKSASDVGGREIKVPGKPPARLFPATLSLVSSLDALPPPQKPHTLLPLGSMRVRSAPVCAAAGAGTSGSGVGKYAGASSSSEDGDWAARRGASSFSIVMTPLGRSIPLYSAVFCPAAGDTSSSISTAAGPAIVAASDASAARLAAAAAVLAAAASSFSTWLSRAAEASFTLSPRRAGSQEPRPPHFSLEPDTTSAPPTTSDPGPGTCRYAKLPKRDTV